MGSVRKERDKSKTHERGGRVRTRPFPSVFASSCPMNLLTFVPTLTHSLDDNKPHSISMEDTVEISFAKRKISEK